LGCFRATLRAGVIAARTLWPGITCDKPLLQISPPQHAAERAAHYGLAEGAGRFTASRFGKFRSDLSGDAGGDRAGDIARDALRSGKRRAARPADTEYAAEFFADAVNDT